MIKLYSVLKSSRAAIDLASIMVGVIIIGLIGGVIAATVFAVIPWSQDKAAKQQLDSVHTAQNAFFGLSSDPSQDLLGGKKNSFASSVELGSNNLLASNPTYCTVSTTDGKDYHAYAKSGSGKWFYALNSNKQAQVLTAGIVPCVDAIVDGKPVVIVDPSVDNGSGSIPTVPGATTPGTGTTPGSTTPAEPTPAPTSSVIFEDNFETKANGGSVFPWSPYTSSGSVYAYTASAHDSKMGARVSDNNANSRFPTIGRVIPTDKGVKYKVTIWVKATDSVQNFRIGYDGVAVGTTQTAPMNVWTQLTFTFTGVGSSTLYIVGVGTQSSSLSNWFYHVDDIKVERIL
jgi:hypothetical protein